MPLTVPSTKLQQICPDFNVSTHIPRDDIFKYIFLNEKFQILIEISLKFVFKAPINNNPMLI